jgi:hypothetical protein
MAGYVIVDQRTGERVTSTAYLTHKQAREDITAWQDRHDRGGRPDVTREMLLNMRVRAL